MEQFKTNANEIIARLARLQKDMNSVKEQIEDITLTKDDLDALEKAEEEFNSGETISHKELKKSLDYGV
ncbi:MAG: hypothetical protein KKB79_03115 [Nanoarchaeota archaeon]|nr:hypothetical protein [Nanoarchaeota archaeon]